MSGEEMINYMKRPQQLNEHSLSELRALLNRYPWFHTAHLLFLLNLKNINDPRYREFLKQSAVYIKDREKFLRLVNRLDASGQKIPPSHETSTDQQPAEAGGVDARSSRSKEADETDVQPARDEEGRKPESRKKDKDFSTEYLRNRISETLSEQKSDKRKEGTSPREEGSDFFIIDKVSQVEEKISKRLREQYEKQHKEKQQDPSPSGQEKTDSFELEKGGEEKPSPPVGGGFAGEYFSERDYRQTREEARKQQNDLIERFIKKAPELQNITPSDEKREDISKPSVREKEDLASERLIKVYIKQGYYQKAIDAYKKLSLKYPEKSDYFAEQIEQLRKNINKQQK